MYCVPPVLHIHNTAVQYTLLYGSGTVHIHIVFLCFVGVFCGGDDRMFRSSRRILPAATYHRGHRPDERRGRFRPDHVRSWLRWRGITAVLGNIANSRRPLALFHSIAQAGVQVRVPSFDFFIIPFARNFMTVTVNKQQQVPNIIGGEEIRGQEKKIWRRTFEVIIPYGLLP